MSFRINYRLKHVIKLVALLIALGWFISCSSRKPNNEALLLGIEYSKVKEFNTTGSLINYAHSKILLKLESYNEPVDSLYITGVKYDSTLGAIMFDIIHYNTILFKRRRELEDSIHGEYVSIPPTGNFSGFDRTMLYYIDTGILNDQLYQ